jgi:hypothetical protein
MRGPITLTKAILAMPKKAPKNKVNKCRFSISGIKSMGPNFMPIASILVGEFFDESFIIIDVYKIDIRITGKIENIC